MLKLPLISLCLFVTATSLARELDRSKISQLERQIEAVTAGLTPGVAIGIVKEGEVVYEQYAGYASLEHQVPVSAKTRFNIASNAKQFTALCILELANEELVDLYDDVRSYLPEMFEEVDADVPVFTLLNHSSGIRDIYELWSLQGHTWWKRFLSNRDALELLGAQRGLNSEPGSTFGYSNSNYLLLAEIVSRVTDVPFADRAKEMFERLGMNETSFLTNAKAVIPNRAPPYGDWNGWKKYPTITSLHGDGGLFTTLPDQLTWERVLQDRSLTDFDESLMDASAAPIEGCEIDEYGYGVSYGTFKGLDYVYHEGNTGAYNATFVRFPKERVSVVVMSNNASLSTYQFARAFAETVLPTGKLKTKTYPRSPEVIGSVVPESELVGAYEMDDETIVRVVKRDGRLYREAYPDPPVPLIRERGNLYRYDGRRDVRIAFDSTESKTQSLMVYQASSPPICGVRREFDPIEKGYAATICGSYWNDETDTEIVIAHRSNNDYAIVKNGRERTGALVVRDRLRERSYVIRIQRNESGKARGLLVDRDRIKNVEFVKR